jgi:hypothetical protein
MRCTGGLLTVMFAAAFLTISSRGQAADGRCLIAVDRHTWLKGQCNVEIRAGGSFTLGVGDKSRSKYFAYVDVDQSSGSGHGYWNGVAAESHAHEDLGELKKRGACWRNKRARICAFR